MKHIRKVYDWMGSKAHSPHALIWLGVLFFLESSCFFIPADPLLIVFCVEHRKKALFYGVYATIFSVLGGIFGYCIGAFLWNTVGATLVHYLISEVTFATLVKKYEYYQTWAVLIGGLTPIPYKAITLSAGFCKLPILPFIGYSLIARGIRFIGLAWLIHKWGSHIKDFIDQYFGLLVLLFVAFFIGGCLILKYS